MTEERYQKTSMRLLGLVYVVIVASFLALTVAIYADAFSDDPVVTLRTSQVGNQMQADADVKLRGINVGRVLSVESRGDGAVLELAMNPATFERIPANVTARLLPKTLFGERYVSLTMPDHPNGKLAPGAAIDHDKSAAGVEMERVLNNLLPLLRSVRPEKLAEMLTALSQALDGRGEQLGDTLVQVGQYVGELNPKLPQIKADISRFAAVADTYGDAADDFLQALSDFTVTSRTIVDQRDALLSLYSSLGTAGTDLTTFLSQNQNTIISLADTGRGTLELLAKYAPSYACLLTAVADFKPRVDKAFADGGLNVRLKVVHDRGKYVPGRDEPVYDAKPGPRCAGPQAPKFLPVGIEPLPNSPAEREMLGAVLGDMPAWGSLLVGPLYRGAEVTVE
ncbi:MCE family protein [Kibdelosporangium persicum]|uniref:ABC-type transport system involved in resistance to organic solvents, periplasmic component n=1 Tax=Kibdelosporangium persicum TaxID=2698649 RepID=A0ABX2EVN2_9PSEU|nr:MCE family protein [Kibdelosporangium persicum]NRN63018.1 ABC-type transport system involved in resistance to organic solvents, periplasmic component [Kibdelosporangium persicum]